MDWKPTVRSAFGPAVTPDDDVIEELAQHAAAAYEAACADGFSPDDAARRVTDQLSAWAADEALRTRRPARAPPVEPPPQGSSKLSGLGGDVRHALHLLRRQWGHALVVVLTLALGVGAASVLVSVAYGVLLKPMPWPDAERLVRVTETRQGSTRPQTFMTNATYLAWSERPSTIEGVAAWSAHSATLTGRGEPERLRAVEASPNLFALLGARPQIGRLFATAGGGAGDTAQVLISDGLWRRRFGARRDAVGRALKLDGAQVTIVGVLPSGFAFPDREVQAYVPFFVPPVGTNGSGGGTLSMFRAIAKLKPGASVEQAAAEATARGRTAPDPELVTIAVFGSKGPVQVSVVSLTDAITGEVRPAILVFLVAVGLLFATATANIASLQLARASGRLRGVRGGQLRRRARPARARRGRRLRGARAARRASRSGARAAVSASPVMSV